MSEHEEIAALLHHLGHPVRLRIALLLQATQLTVSQLEEHLQIKQPNLSQHLAVLRKSGMVQSVREAKSVTYTLATGLPQRLTAAIVALLQDSAPPASAPVALPESETSHMPHAAGDELVFATIKYPERS
ncbi:metalloregulator ArsR/SmtB family transcription factor [Pseudescherichia sp.]|uniref:ArsR/SmtB family transcription factor n=1 Tax=Pseudescherichia sp. TaxID=2055881 RepID=UPI00289BBBF0|nr:metalloregulator ArsR/SmtB family transcription factor [Pseudescherichia sp.]